MSVVKGKSNSTFDESHKKANLIPFHKHADTTEKN